MDTYKTKEIVENFYKFFHASDFDKLLSLIDDNVVHEFNYVKTYGKEKLIEFIKTSKAYYDERIDNYILMISNDGQHATTKFTVKGKYIQTDSSLVPANGQSYELNVINYFEIKDNKIVKGSCWYNENDWIQQVT